MRYRGDEPISLTCASNFRADESEAIECTGFSDDSVVVVGIVAFSTVVRPATWVTSRRVPLQWRTGTSKQQLGNDELGYGTTV